MIYVLAKHDEYPLQYVVEVFTDRESVRKYFENIGKDEYYQKEYKIIEGRTLFRGELDPRPRVGEKEQ